MTQNAPPRSLTGFPVQLSSFVGRVVELQDVMHALDRHRLVTLVGPGGSGKTRLALEAARARASERQCYVDLAPIGGRDGVDAALAVATDAPEGPGETPLDATIRRIGDAAALLVLDNCDQVIAACAHAADALLRACPQLTVLATSRERLRVEAEHLWRVPPLALPTDDESLDGDALLLFLDRAGLSPDVAVHDRVAIHQICRRLDGMPLAIELAASRAAMLPVTDILAGLAYRFRLLTSGARTVDTRQQSLAASIHWSYRLLTEDERTVLERLSVICGPFAAVAARSIAAGDGISESDVLPLLANLVEKSFVVVDQRDRGSCYRLLETIRDYAGGHLEARPKDAHATRTRHLRYLRDTAERLARMIEEGTPARDWPAQFQSDLSDIAAAIGWAGETGNADDALRLIGGLHWFWHIRARGEDRRLIDGALAIKGGDPRWRAKAFSAATRSAMSRLDPAAIEFGQEAVRIAVESGDPATSALALTCLGHCYVYLDISQARQHLLEACELAREADDRQRLAEALQALMYTEMGDLRAARARGEQVLAIAEPDGNQLTACHVRIGLSSLSVMQGRLEDAMQFAGLSLRTAEALDERVIAVMARILMAGSAVLRGDDDAADKHSSAADAWAKASGNPLLTGMAALSRGMRCYANGNLDHARTALVEAIPALLAGGLLTPWVDEWLTDASLRAGDITAAREHAAHAATVVEQSGNDWGRSHAALARSRIDLYQGNVDDATQGAHVGLDLAQRTEDMLTTIDTLELLAAIAVRRRSPVTAVRLLGAASAARSNIGYARFKLHIADYETLVRDLEGALDAADFTRVWDEGEKMSLADAVTLARTRRGSRRRPATGWDALTPAELRVVQLVSKGLSNVQIAERLCVTRETVKGHVSAALRKLGVHNRVELVAEATRRAADP